MKNCTGISVQFFFGWFNLRKIKNFMKKIKELSKILCYGKLGNIYSAWRYKEELIND